MTYRNILAAMGAAFALWIASPDASAQINLPDAPDSLTAPPPWPPTTMPAAPSTRVSALLLSIPRCPKPRMPHISRPSRLSANAMPRHPRCSKHMPPNIPRARGPRESGMAVGGWYFAARDYAAAMRCYSAITPRELNDADALELRYRTAYCHMLLADYTTARNLFEEVSRSSHAGEYGPASVFYLGYIDYREGNTDGALRRFKAVSSDPEVADVAQIYLAQIYYSRGDNENALAAARKGAQEPSGRIPSRSPAHSGRDLYNLGRSEEAVPLLWVYAGLLRNRRPAPSISSAPTSIRPAGIRKLPHCSTVWPPIRRPWGRTRASSSDKPISRAATSIRPLLAFERAMNSDYDAAVAETAAYNHAVAGIDGGQVPFGSSVAARSASSTAIPTVTMLHKWRNI